MPVSIKKGAPPGAQPSSTLALGAELGAAADELNNSLQRAELAFAELRLGVTADVELPDEQIDTNMTLVRRLRFGKEDRTWRLLYVSFIDEDPENTCKITPLVNTSREVRVEAAAYLPKLVDALIATAKAEIALVRERTAAVDQLTAMLRSGGGAK